MVLLLSTINQALFSTASRNPGVISAPPEPQCDSTYWTENWNFPVSSCLTQKLSLDMSWFLFHGAWYWGSSATGLTSEQGIAGKTGSGFGESTEWVPGGLKWSVSREEMMNSQGIKEEILPGCRDLEAALQRQLFRGVSSFLAWANAHTYWLPCAGCSWLSALPKLFWDYYYYYCYYFLISAGN